MIAFLSRRLTLLALTVFLAIPAVTRADPQDDALVAQAVAYLEGLTAAKGMFQQTDPRGVTVTGAFYLARPGRARFQYDPPSGLLITSDGKTVIMSDSRLKTFQHFALSSTPLALFLADHIRLDKGAKVTRVEHNADSFSITARDSHGLSQGQVTLYFAEAPVRLSGWALIDAQGRATQVALGPLSPMSDPDPGLFTQTQ
ncbi:MAG TPA: outer-membrane lipoprotein carrier protein LolA [Caulobacteraceae bacterium]|nr:outer-membrane lipoprotein carrier protein LolA [Caulobacteraceae bacterium]